MWAEDSFASAELTTRFNNLTSGMGNYTSIKQFADATYAKTEIEAWVNSTRSYLTVGGSAITMGSGGQFVQVGLGTVRLTGTYVDLDGANVDVGNAGSIVKMWGQEVEFHADSFLTDVRVDSDSVAIATLPSGYQSMDFIRSASLSYSTNNGSAASNGYILSSATIVQCMKSISFNTAVISGTTVLTGIKNVDWASVLPGSSAYLARFPTGISATPATLSRTYVNSLRGVSKSSSQRSSVTKKL